MLEHQIKVLTSLKDNPKLFDKELQKSFKWLNKKEQIQLQQWLKLNFPERHLVRPNATPGLSFAS